MTLLAGALPILIGWLLIALANNIEMLFVARVLCGISIGLTFIVLPYYLGEISSTKIRGFITTLLQIGFKIGILYAYAIAPYVSISTMAWISLIPPLAFVTSYIFLPESPYYLLARGKTDQAFKSLVKLRGHESVQDELKYIQEAVQTTSSKRGTFKELFSDRAGRHGCLIMCLLGIIQSMCGYQAVLAYSTIIFAKITSELGANESSIILAVVTVLTSFLASAIVDIVGRKLLLIVSLSGMVVTNLIIGIYFSFERFQIDGHDFGYMAFAALLVFVLSFNIGLASVPFTIASEIYPKHLKKLAGCIITVISVAVSVTVNKLFQIVSDSWGNDVPFWIFALCSIVYIPFVLFAIPETRGKDFDVILKELNTRGIFSHYMKCS